MAVQLELACRSGDDDGVEAGAQAVRHQLRHQPAKDDARAVLRLHGEQTDLADPSVRWKVRIQVLDLRIERERAHPAHGDHSEHPLAATAHDVRILPIEAVDQLTALVRRMLRDLLDERSIVQAMDLLALAEIGRDLEGQRLVRG